MWRKGVIGTNWFDMLLVLIIGGYALIGFRTGFVGGLARLLGALLGLTAALNFYRPLSDTLNLKWNLVSAIGSWIPVSSLGARGRIPGQEILNPARVPGAESQLLAPKGALYSLQGLGESLTRVLASGILDILCFILIFLVVSWAVKTLGALFGKLARMFFLGPVDRAAGALLGAVKGGVIAGVLVALVNALQVPAGVLSGSSSSNWISLAFQKSALVPYFVKALVVLNVKFPGWGI